MADPRGSRRLRRADRTGAPTRQRLLHATVKPGIVRLEIDKVATTVRRMADTTTLDRLFSRGVLDDRQQEAGSRFWSDWYHAGMMQRTTAAYADAPWPRSERTGMAVTERQVFARQRLRAAREALGSHLGRVVEAVLVDELDLADAGRKLFGRRDSSQARASATDTFKIGLDTLADHYGL